MTISVRRLTFMTFAGLLIIFNLNAAFAQDGGRKHQGPPPEAYTVCEGKSEGDTASFETPNGDTVTGICVLDRSGDRLVLRPDNPPPEHEKPSATDD